MTERTSLIITDDRRRMEDRLREQLDEIPDTQFRAALYDMALTHLLDSLRNAEDMELGDVCHDCKTQMNTRVVKYRSNEYVDTQRP